jgi:hypothetical protein
LRAELTGHLVRRYRQFASSDLAVVIGVDLLERLRGLARGCFIVAAAAFTSAASIYPFCLVSSFVKIRSVILAVTEAVMLDDLILFPCWLA